MMCSRILICLCIFSPFWSNAQILKGQTLNAKDRTPVAFVNIGIVGGHTGTVSDVNGQFELDLTGQDSGATVKFSSIGFETRSFQVSELLANVSAGLKLRLEPMAYRLSEVRVTPKNYRIKRVGNDMKTRSFSAGFKDNLLGHEVGTRMKIKPRPAMIEEITVNFARCEYDSIFFRVNIYSMKDGLPDENLLSQPIFIRSSRFKAMNGISLDVRDRSIWVHDDFLISLELIKDLGEGGLYFSSGLFASPTFVRHTSQSDWEKLPMGIGVGIGALISQERK